jgi:enterochelin esterase-like enzyme
MTAAPRIVAWLVLALLGGVAFSGNAFARPKSDAATRPATDGGRVETFQFQSDALARPARVHVYLPRGYDTAPAHGWPYFIALHGLGGEGRDWFEAGRGGLRQDLDALIRERVIAPVVVIAPDGGNGYWTDHVGAAPGTAYGRFIAEAEAAARARFRLDPRRAGIVGASMGGHGALSHGLQAPEHFRGIVSLAGALFDVPPVHRPIYLKVWGQPTDVGHWSKTAPMALALSPGLAERAPPIFLHCGRADRDRFWDWNVQAFDALRKQGFSVTFQDNDGGHGWTTWREMNRRWLVWLDQRLRV